MERVEVLRGPQGTLFGAASLGGSIRNIPATPQLDRFSASAHATYSQTAGFGGNNYEAWGALNAPLAPGKFAVRVVGYDYANSGYIHNVGASVPALVNYANLVGATIRNRGDVGSSDYVGGRLTALWQVTEAFDLKLTYANQQLESDGFNEVDISLPQGGYTSAPLEVGGPKGGEFYTDDIEIANLLARYHWHHVDFISSTSYFAGPRGEARDVSRDARLPIFALDFLGEADRRGFIQEVRASTDLDGPLNGILGAYYEDLHRTNTTDAVWIGGAQQNPFPGTILSRRADFDIEQIAVFGELNWRVTDRLTVTPGARWFDYDRKQDRFESGVFAGAPATFLKTAESDTSLKLNVSYRPAEGALLYAQWAQGFRFGQPGAVPPVSVCDTNGDGLLDGTTAPVAPGDVQSDTADSYELGGKFAWADGRVQLDTSIYRVDWVDLPVRATSPTCGFTVTVNAGAAYSQGAEVEARFRPWPALALTLGGSYIDAEFTETFRGLGKKGDRLPGSAEVTASAGVQYEFQIGLWPSYFRLDASHVGSFHGDVAGALPELGDYTLLGARLSTTIGGATLSLFGTNLTDEDALIAAISATRAWRQRPRTIGLELGFQFE
jgi:outer membrane receptor protein involved in Fe transport